MTDSRILDQIDCVIEETEEECPGLFLAYYLCGSQLDDTANRLSDIDLILVPQEPVPTELKAKFNSVYERVYKVHEPEIGILVLELSSLTDLPAYSKFAQHLHGVDCFQDIPLQSLDKTIQSYIHGSFRFLKLFLRDEKEVLKFPLEIPCENDVTLGYRFPKLESGFNCKRLVSAIARMSGAILALKLEKQPASKKECVGLYGREADLPYSGFVRNSFQTMHSDWEYLVIEDSLMEFQKILLEFNSFENMYLREIYPYLQKLESKGCSENWFEWCKSAIDLEKLNQ